MDAQEQEANRKWQELMDQLYPRTRAIKFGGILKIYEDGTITFLGITLRKGGK